MSFLLLAKSKPICYNYCLQVTIQNRPKHLLLRPYEHDSVSKNPIAGGDLHGFLHVSVHALNRYVCNRISEKNTILRR